MPEIQPISNNTVVQKSTNVNNNSSNHQITGQDIAVFLIGSYLDNSFNTQTKTVKQEQIEQKEDMNIAESFLDCLCNATAEIIIDEGESLLSKIYKDIFKPS